MKTYRHIFKLEDEIVNLKVKCSCGHTVVLTKQDPVKICSHCNHIVYKTDRDYFKWKLNPERKGLPRG